VERPGVSIYLGLSQFLTGHLSSVSLSLRGWQANSGIGICAPLKMTEPSSSESEQFCPGEFRRRIQTEQRLPRIGLGK
jgi:hypothetical protein